MTVSTTTATATDTPEATLERDFRAACEDLAAALEQQRCSDTYRARARVDRCRAAVDRVLDGVLDLRTAARR